MEAGEGNVVRALEHLSEADLVQILRFGKMQKGVRGAGIVLVALQDGGSSIQGIDFKTIEELPSCFDFGIGLLRQAEAVEIEGLLLVAFDEQAKQAPLCHMTPDLEVVDIWATFIKRIEEKGKTSEKRKTRSRKRKSGADRAPSNRWIETSAKSSLGATDLATDSRRRA